MTLPRDISPKITFAIDMLAEWFYKETGSYLVDVSYHTGGGDVGRLDGPYWEVQECTPPYKSHIFGSFTALRLWMEREVRKRKILFRQF